MSEIAIRFRIGSVIKFSTTNNMRPLLIHKPHDDGPVDSLALDACLKIRAKGIAEILSGGRPLCNQRK